LAPREKAYLSILDIAADLTGHGWMTGLNKRPISESIDSAAVKKELV